MAYVTDLALPEEDEPENPQRLEPQEIMACPFPLYVPLAEWRVLDRGVSKLMSRLQRAHFQ